VISILLAADRPEWTSTEAKELRSFLTSDTGVKVLTLCAFESPPLFDGADVNKSLVRSGEHKGFERAIEFLTSLVHTEPEKPEVAEAYPSLDDDTKWGDTNPAPTQK
jgi:hypothetical protein